MGSQMITRLFSALCLLFAFAAQPAHADNINNQIADKNINSDLVMSSPTSAEPMRLTIKHPKNTSVHITIVTDSNSSASVDYTDHVNADSTIAYTFPAGQARNVTVLDGRGQELWSLLDGQVSVQPTGADAARSHALLAQLDRDYTILPPALHGVYTLHRPAAEFLSTTDIARTDTAGTTHRWAHHSSPILSAPMNSRTEETTIIISPTTNAAPPVRRTTLD